MRDVVFLVADRTMQQVLEGFFGREKFHVRLGCGPFDVDARQGHDVVSTPGLTDGGLFHRGHELLPLYMRTHRHAVLMLDAEWGGSPGAVAIERDLAARAARVWDADRLDVIVPDPEIESWFWLPDNPHVAAAMGYTGERPYREVLAAADLWPEDRAKPPRPKEALEHLHRWYGTDVSPAVRRRAAENAAVKHCQDPAFLRLRATLRRWFPVGDRRQAT